MTTLAAASGRRHWLPSIPALVFVGILAFILLVFQDPLLNSDGDLPRHLRHGEWMLEQHHLVRADAFSYTMAGRPFVGFEYGSQLVYALAHRAGGLAAVTALAALLIASAYALLARFLLRRRVEPLLACGLTGAAVSIGMGHWLARPHLFTLVAVPLLLELLWPVGRWRWWPFVVLFAIWANVHGGFAYGLGVISLFLGGAVIEARHQPGGLIRNVWVRRHAAAFALSAAASLLNPWGAGVYRHIVAMFRDHYIIDHTAEFASPDFHDPASKIFLLVIVGVMVAGLLSRRRPAAVIVLSVAAGVWLALVSQRNAPLFGFTALPLLGIHLDPEWRQFRFVRHVGAGMEKGAAGAATAPWVCLAAALVIALGLRHGRLGGRQLLADSFSADRTPTKAVAAARAAGLSGHMFSEFGWGGYLQYAWPEQKVFIDGGTDFYGGRLMRDYGIIRDARPGWQDLIRQWDIAGVIVPPEAPIASELARDHGWRYWYCDATAVVLVPANRDVPRSPHSPADSRQCTPKPEAGDSA